MKRAVPFVVFVVALTVYVLTLAPTVGLVDSGALTVAAHRLGNAHPPGFPLYLLLTKLFTLLPVGSIAVRANLASAVFAAAAAAMVALCAGEALSWQRPLKKKEKPRIIDDGVTAILMLFAGLLTAFSRTLWGYATVAEVYALNTFLIATVLWLMLGWRRTGETRRLYAASLVFGLALGVHHLTVGLTLLAIGILVVATDRSVFTSRRVLVAAGIALTALIAVYSYLPLAASADPVLNWGDPDSVSRFIGHITARQYRAYMTAASQGAQIDAIVAFISREFGPRWLPLALLTGIAGLIATLRRDVALGWALIMMVLASAGWMLFYPIVNDKDAYLLPAFVALTIAAACGAAALSRNRVALAAAFLILPLVAAVVHWPYRDRSDFRVAERYVDNTLRGIAPNALLLTNDWQVWAPMFYFRESEGRRKDVVPIEYGMLIRGWYIEQLERHVPHVMEPVRKELDVYKPLLLISETDDKRWQDPAVQQAFNQRLDDLVVAMVSTQVAAGARVYATPDLAMSGQPADAMVVRRLTAAWDIVPAGVAMEFRAPSSAPQTSLPPLDLRGVADGSMKYESDDVVVTEVLSAYRNVTLIRARYLALQKQYEPALAEYRTAARLDPENQLIPREIRSVEAARGQ